MRLRYPFGLTVLLLAAFLMGAPAASPGADLLAVPDNAVGQPPAPDRGTDNVSALPPDDLREPAFGDEETVPAAVADPIKPINRAVFAFNDKAYYWFLKPVAKGYNYVVPEGVRVSVRNFFSNIATPVRATNNLLQGNIRATGTELLRFVINSTTGMLGLFDTARDNFGIDRKDADLGQTLGKYGLGQGIYIVLPLLGPTTLRDGVGLAGDAFLYPISYINPPEASFAVYAYGLENNLSLRLGAYEEITEAAVDPYIAFRDAYLQYRANLVRWKRSPGP
jgi:phospholipid-binding lipoprotein MlaA